VNRWEQPRVNQPAWLAARRVHDENQIGNANNGDAAQDAEPGAKHAVDGADLRFLDVL